MGTFVLRVDAADSQGVTALMLAAGSGDLNMVETLLTHGADIGGARWCGRFQSQGIACARRTATPPRIGV